MTRAPSRWARATQARPIPPAAPVTRTVSSAWSRARSTRAIRGGGMGGGAGCPAVKTDVVGGRRGPCPFGALGFGKAAEPAAATDPVAGTKARDPLAAGNHHAGGVGAGDVGERRPH